VTLGSRTAKVLGKIGVSDFEKPSDQFLDLIVMSY
jgi:hypothetical protein